MYWDVLRFEKKKEWPPWQMTNFSHEYDLKKMSKVLLFVLNFTEKNAKVLQLSYNLRINCPTKEEKMSLIVLKCPTIWFSKNSRHHVTAPSKQQPETTATSKHNSRIDCRMNGMKLTYLENSRILFLEWKIVISMKNFGKPWGQSSLGMLGKKNARLMTHSTQIQRCVDKYNRPSYTRYYHSTRRDRRRRRPISVSGESYRECTNVI